MTGKQLEGSLRAEDGGRRRRGRLGRRGAAGVDPSEEAQARSFPSPFVIFALSTSLARVDASEEAQVLPPSLSLCPLCSFYISRARRPE